MNSAIKKVCVIGGGTMGSGIAAHCANAGVEVLLLEIADKQGDPLGVAKQTLTVPICFSRRINH